MRLLIGNTEVGEGYPVFIVEEVVPVHDTAHAFIDIAANAGVDENYFNLDKI